MTAKGFDMTTKIVVDEKKHVGKANKKEHIKTEIIKAGNSVTVSELVEKYNVSDVYANTALRELTNEGKLNKIGRGPSAKWVAKEKLTAVLN
tara:strand:+ start:61 stop:336 length:276 start_codon:yes stop_codon:yes gene_type:complete